MSRSKQEAATLIQQHGRVGALRIANQRLADEDSQYANAANWLHALCVKDFCQVPIRYWPRFN